MPPKSYTKSKKRPASKAGGRQSKKRLLDRDSDASASIETSDDDAGPTAMEEAPRQRFWDGSVEDGWSSQDEAIVANSSGDELKLWRWTEKLFGVAPPDMLPLDHDVDIDGNKVLKNHTTGKTYQSNPNWSKRFCQAFSTVICCPVFEGRVDVFQYAVQHAMSLRARSNYPFDLPSEDVLGSGRNKKVMAELLKYIEFDGEEESIFETVLESQLGPDVPQDIGFLEYLKEVVLTDNKRLGITLRDLQAIQMAWDAYATHRARSTRLKSMDDYRDCVSKLFYASNNKQQGETVETQTKGKKKSWMIEARKRAQAKSPRRNLEASPALNTPKVHSRRARKSKTAPYLEPDEGIHESSFPEVDDMLNNSNFDESHSEDVGEEDDHDEMEDTGPTGRDKSTSTTRPDSGPGRSRGNQPSLSASKKNSGYNTNRGATTYRPGVLPARNRSRNREISTPTTTLGQPVKEPVVRVAKTGPFAASRSQRVPEALASSKKHSTRDVIYLDDVPPSPGPHAQTPPIPSNHKRQPSNFDIPKPPAANKPAVAIPPIPVHGDPTSNTPVKRSKTTPGGWRAAWKFKILSDDELDVSQTASKFDFERRSHTAPTKRFFLQPGDDESDLYKETWSQQWPYENLGVETKLMKWNSGQPRSPFGGGD